MSLMDWIKPNRPRAGTDVSVGPQSSTATIAEPDSPATVAALPLPSHEESEPMSTASVPSSGAATAATPDSPPTQTAPPVATVPATFAELNAEFADDPSFIVECLGQARTMADAHKAYGKRMKAERDKFAAIGNAGKGGTDPVGGVSKPATGGDYMTEVNRVAKAERIPMHEAIGRVNAERPDLRIAYIENNRRVGLGRA